MAKAGLRADGKLKPGHYYGKGGKVLKAKKKPRTKLYAQAKALGRAGGKATARKQRKLF
jgi:hypothetical protein